MFSEHSELQSGKFLFETFYTKACSKRLGKKFEGSEDQLNKRKSVCAGSDLQFRS